MKRTIPVLLGLSLGLVGCGGGGGGGDNTAGGVTINYDGPSPTTVATIDSTEKADAAVTAAVAAVMNMDATSPGSYKVDGATGASASLMQLTMQEAADRIMASGSAVVLTGATQTQQCSSGGTMTVETREADPNTVSPGDYVRVRYDHCMLDYATEMHGVMYSEVKQVTGMDPYGDYALTLYMEMGLSMQSGTDYVAMDGAYTGALSYVTSTSTTTMTMVGDRFAIEFDDGTDHFVQLMTDFDMSISAIDYSDVTAEYNFTVTNSLMGGSVTVTTHSPFRVAYGDQYPYAGQIEIRGTGGVMLTVQSSELVLLQYDLDGDTNYESHEYKYWYEL